MKKFLLITLDFYPKTGGVANYYWNLCKGLAKGNKGRVMVLTEKEQGSINNKQGLGFNICRKNLITKLPIWPKWPLMFFYIFKIVKKEQVEMMWAGEILPTGTAVYFLSKFLKIPYIVSCHGNDILQARKKKRKEKLARKILQNATYVAVNSKYTGGLAKEMGVSQNKIKVVYPGVEIREFGNSEIGKLKDKPILLSLGRLVERKGFDNVIRALPQVWQKIPELVYVIVGDGCDKHRLQQLAKQVIQQCSNVTMKQYRSKRKDDQILFLDTIGEKQKDILYNLCDVFIMPARESKDDVEGFGIVYLEAASFTKPVIAGRGGGVREAVVDNETGILVDGKNADEIAGAIIKLFKDKDLREKLGRQGRERVEKEFSWEKSAGEFEKLLG